MAHSGRGSLIPVVVVWGLNLVGELVLRDRKLLQAAEARGYSRQLAAGGAHQLGPDGAADGILEIVDGTIAHGHVEPAGMSAVDIRERALRRQVEAVADVLLIARMIGKVPRRAIRLASVRILDRSKLAGEALSVTRAVAADIVGGHERGVVGVGARPVRLDGTNPAGTWRSIAGERALTEENGGAQSVDDGAERRGHRPRELGVAES